MLNLSMFDKRTALPWVVSGLVIGSMNALLLDWVKQNVLFLVHDGLLGGWILFLTAIASTYIKEIK